MAQNGQLTLEDARIVFRNFAGKEGMYNREGDRNFCVLLDEPLATDMAKDGWNIKFLKPREEGDEPQPYIQVSVSYKNRPPRIVMVTSRGRTNLTESEVELLDWVDIKMVDLIVNPYHWNVSGKTGVKAYMQSIYITIQEDPLELKYADVPEIESATKALPAGSSESSDGDDDVIDVEAWEDGDEPKELEAAS